jgi:hypothetical protein
METKFIQSLMQTTNKMQPFYENTLSGKNKTKDDKNTPPLIWQVVQLANVTSNTPCPIHYFCYLARVPPEMPAT